MEVISQSAPPGSLGQWDAVISRKGMGERIACRAIFPKAWHGDVLVWSHPEGRQSLTAVAIAPALDAGWAVVAIDRFSPGESWGKQPAMTRPGPNPPYMGMVLCHNRSILAERVHDLLSVIALVKGWNKARNIHLVSFADAGTEALLARALAGEAIAHAAIVLGEFDLDQVTDPADPMLLPGALKYGGIAAFISPGRGGETFIAAPPSSLRRGFSTPSRLSIETTPTAPSDLVKRALRTHLP